MPHYFDKQIIAAGLLHLIHWFLLALFYNHLKILPIPCQKGIIQLLGCGKHWSLI